MVLAKGINDVENAGQPIATGGEAVGESRAYFFQTMKTGEDIRYYLPWMICAAVPDEVFVQGNFNTPNADSLMIVFEKCDQAKNPEITCETEENISKYMSGMYMFTISNEKKFIQYNFGEDRVVSQAETKWWALSANSRTDFV